MMANRLIELHRVLKPTGSLYLHCDPTASHYLKIVLDGVFGKDGFKNEVIWQRTAAHGSARRWAPVHDIIHFVSKSDQYIWTNPSIPHHPNYISKHFRQTDKAGRRYQAISLTGAGKRNGESGQPWRGINPTNVGRHWAVPREILERANLTGKTVQDRLDALDKAGLIYWPKDGDGTPRLIWYADELSGMAISDVWADVAPISAQAQERLGYPTQKPLALLERIISASSNEGDVVLDPFCGCGTAVHAAQKLGRKWIGIDITHLAIALIEKRLKDAFGAKLEFEVHGAPKDLDAARDLAERDKYQFQWWACSLVNAQPFGGKKKGADGGIDGVIYFQDEKGPAKQIIVSVKGGNNVSVAMIRDLAHVVEREKAAIGIFITLAPPTRPMQTEAVKCGYYESPMGRSYPKVQILSVEDLLSGQVRAEYPDLMLGGLNFKKAQREKEQDTQERLF